MEFISEQKLADGVSQFFLNEPTGQAINDLGCAYLTSWLTLRESYSELFKGNFSGTMSVHRIAFLEGVSKQYKENIDRAPKSALILTLGAVKGFEVFYLALMTGAALVKTVNALNGNNDLTVDQLTQHSISYGQAILATCGATWLQEKLQRQTESQS